MHFTVAWSLLFCLAAGMARPAFAGEASFASFSPPKPIAEIMALKPGGMIPAEIYTKYPAKLIALSLVHKKYLETEKPGAPTVGKPAYDYLRGTEIQLAFPEKHIAAINSRGFLNVHQISPESAYGRARAKREDEWFGVGLGPDSEMPAGAAALRPKSAYLSFAAGRAEDTPLGRGSSSLALGGYGNVFAVFKEEIKDRTTFTMGDSGLSHPGQGDVRTLRYASGDNLKIAPNGGNYVEAQIWGPLSVRDVDHFMVRCESNISEAGLRELKQLGKPIYECTVDSVNGRRVRLTKGNLLYAPGGAGESSSAEPGGSSALSAH